MNSINIVHNKIYKKIIHKKKRHTSNTNLYIPTLLIIIYNSQITTKKM